MSTITQPQDALAPWPESTPGAADPSSGKPRGRGLTYLALATMVIPAIALLVLGVIAGMPPDEGDIQSGVTIGNYEVSSVGWERTSVELQRSFASYLEEPVTLVVEGQQMQVSPKELGIAFDVDATHARALTVGRGGLFDSARERFIAKTQGTEIEPVVIYDREQYLQTLSELMADSVVPPVNANYYWDGQQIAIQPSVGGTGIDTSAAVALLQKAVANFDHGPIEIPTVPVAPDVTTADLEAALADANRLAGQPVTLFDNGVAWQMRAEELAPLLQYEDGEVTIDMNVLSARIAALEPSVHQVAKNADIARQEDGTFRIIPETIERSLDVPASTEALEEALASGETEVTLVVDEKNPPITKERILPLFRELNGIVARGMVVDWPGGNIAEMDKVALSNALIYDIQNGEVGFDKAKFIEALKPIAEEQVNRPPSGLRWKGGQLVSTEGAQPGLAVDLNASADKAMQAALEGHGAASLVVTETSGADAAALGIEIRDVLGSASTYYGDSSGNRKTNIEVAAAALDGALVAPHSEFSFNDAIGGTTTLEDGYMMGYGIITNDSGTPITVPSVAGGICQVSTTVFQAAFWSGMPITNRSWHLYWIPRYGTGPGGLKGLDATVDPEYGLDFNFHNPTDDWLAISAYADGQWITVEVRGVNQGWTVDVGEPQITNVTPKDETVYRQEDPTMSPGQEVWVETAQEGFSASIHRVVKDKDGNVLEDRTFDSYYTPARNVILVAPGEA